MAMINELFDFVAQLGLPQGEYAIFGSGPLIDTADIIDGLPFVRLRYVIEYKTIRSAPKDLAHIEASRLAGCLEN